MKARKPLTAVGSSFDSGLAAQGDTFKADVIAGAMKRQFVMKLRAMMKAHGLGVNGHQKLLRTGPSQVQRLLEPEDVGISLKSIAKVLAVFGQRVRLPWSRGSPRNGWAAHILATVERERARA